MVEFSRGIFFLNLSGNKEVEELPEKESTQAFSPSTDIFETKGGVHIVIELPGVDVDSVSVNVYGNRLSVQGVKEEEKVQEGAVFLCMERRYGQFKKDFEIVGALNTRSARASYKDGVLKIFLERCEEKRGKGKRVAVETEVD